MCVYVCVCFSITLSFLNQMASLILQKECAYF